MTEPLDIEILQRRMKLKNMIDQRNAKQKDIYYLNLAIEDEEKKIHQLHEELKKEAIA